MPYRPGLSVAVYLLLTAVACAAPGRTLTGAQWRENIDFVAATLRAHHPDPFKYSDEAAFDAALADLKTRLPELEDDEAFVALAAAVAGLNDGNTALRAGAGFFAGRYPLEFYAFDDGLFVTAAPPDRQDLIDAQLIAIDGIDARDAYHRVAKAAAHDNDMTLLVRASALLASPDVLHATGVAKRRDRAAFTFVRRDGSLRTYEFAPQPFEEELVWTADAPPEEQPLRRRPTEGNYSSRLIDDGTVLYVRVDRIRAAEDDIIADFAADQARVERDSDPHCVLIDIRDSTGDNGASALPFYDWAKRSPAVDRKKFFVAIGRNTISGGLDLATSLERRPEVLFIGEPTGSRPNSFDDPEDFDLPYGDLTLSVSSMFWIHTVEDDAREALAPDIPVAETSADYFDFRDPVLEEVRRRCE